VTLGSKMDQGINVVVAQQLFDEPAISNRSTHKGEAAPPVSRAGPCGFALRVTSFEVGAIASIGQGIKGNDIVVRISTLPVVNEIGTDKSCSAGNQ